MARSGEAAELSIREVVERTGVAEATLRVWERRYGVPAPARLPSGHRRYSERDVEVVERIAAERGAGLSLGAAIERARAQVERPPASLYAALRARRPELAPQALRQPTLLALTRALEDESLARAEDAVLFGSFQRERFYRRSERRWRELARPAHVAVALADFPRRRTPRAAPAEVPVARDDPLTREWAVVCDAEGHAVCLAAWERPPAGRSAARVFETLWSVEPAIVREAARICARITAAVAPALVEPARARLDAPPSPPHEAQLRLATAIATRALAYAADASPHQSL
jgi:DNA-binding transcriptional MerR regulator